MRAPVRQRLARLASVLACFGALRRERGGVVIVEFAIALPFLMTLYMVSYIITDMLACNRKVTIAARELTDLASRYPELSSSQTATILGASQQVLVPYNYTNAMVRLTEVQVVDLTHVSVVWSQALNGTALTVGTAITVPAGLISSNMVPSATTSGNYCSVNGTSGGYSPSGVTNVPAGCMMFGEVGYVYTPAIRYNSFTSMNLYDSIYMMPRVSSGIPQIS